MPAPTRPATSATAARDAAARPPELPGSPEDRGPRAAPPLVAGQADRLEVPADKPASPG